MNVIPTVPDYPPELIETRIVNGTVTHIEVNYVPSEKNMSDDEKQGSDLFDGDSSSAAGDEFLQKPVQEKFV